jgi:hypothetical protein
MAAVRRKLVVERGANPILVLNWKDAEGLGRDLSGYTAKLHIRAAITDATLLEDWTTANAAITLNADGVNGRITVSADTRSSTWHRGVYDLEVYPGGDESQGRRLLQGEAELSWDVSR